MFCTKCGTENANDAKFCRSCGNPMQTGNVQMKDSVAAPTPTPAPTPVQAPKVAPAPKAPAENKKTFTFDTKLLVKIGIGAAVVLVAIIGIALFVGKMGRTINLNKYVKVEASGYDGFGEVYVDIDWDAIMDKYEGKINYTGKGKKEFGNSYVKNVDAINTMRQYVSISLDKNHNVSNGEELTYTFVVDDKCKEYFKCNLKYKDGTFKTDELTELAKFDAFADLEVSFSGIAPYGNLNMTYQGSELNSYDFSADRYDGLSNGETITVSITPNKVEYCAEYYGKIPNATEKEYTVSGLSSYITKVSDIDDDTLTAMQNQASDVYNAYVARDWEADTAHLESFTYLGNYLLTVKNPESYYGNNNMLYLVYKVQARNNYTNDDGETFNKVSDVYWYIAYKDLMVSDGKVVDFDVTRYEIPNAQFTIDSEVHVNYWNTMRWNYRGYDSLDNLYKEVVTSKIDSYNHEENINKEAASTTVVVEEEEDTTNDSGYILEKSNKELLTKADLEGLTADECKKARNEIYARHGRKFTDEALQQYFDSCEWYEGTIEPDDFDEDVLSDIEKENRDLIVEYEKEMGYN